MKLSTDGRVRLIAALRAHPQRSSAAVQAIVKGRKISELRKEDLTGAALAAGIDLAPYSRAGDGADVAPDAEAAPQVLEAALDARAGAAGVAPIAQGDERQAVPSNTPQGAAGTGDADAAEVNRILSLPLHPCREAVQALLVGRRGLENTVADLAGHVAMLTSEVQTLQAELARVPTSVQPEMIAAALPTNVVPLRDDALRDEAVRKPVSLKTRETAGKLFELPRSAPQSLRDRIVAVYDDPTAPPIDPSYQWDYQTLDVLLACLEKGTLPWLYGPKSSGKTSAAEQIAARTGRAFFLIGFDASMTRLELFGGLRIAREGNVSVSKWVHGAYTLAIQHPQAIVLLDEITTGRPGELIALHAALNNRYVMLEDGALVHQAPGVLVMAADNTNGAGDESNTYEDTRRMNVALLDRFGVFLPFEYLPAAREIATLTARVPGLPTDVARIMVDYAGKARAKVNAGDMQVPPGLRNLIAWGRLLTAGIEPKFAWAVTCAGSLSGADREGAHQIANAVLDTAKITALLAGTASPEAASSALPAGVVSTEEPF